MERLKEFGRPAISAGCFLIMFNQHVIAPYIIGELTPLPPQAWGLMTVAIGFWFASRGIEKVKANGATP